MFAGRQAPYGVQRFVAVFKAANAQRNADT